MKKKILVLALLAAMVMCMGSVTVLAKEDTSFKDVPNGAWYEDAVQWAYDEGITNGTSASTFSPDDFCTRAQLVTFLWRANGSPSMKNSNLSFTDVPEGTWYTDAVLWACDKKIITPASDDTFDVNGTVSRAVAFTVLWKLNGQTMDGAAEYPFVDVPADAWYADTVSWAYGNGITNGTSENTFSPNLICTRAQFVTMLYRMYGN